MNPALVTCPHDRSGANLSQTINHNDLPMSKLAYLRDRCQLREIITASQIAADMKVLSKVEPNYKALPVTPE